MKAERWVHWAQIIASLAVMTTVVFLVVELRMTRRALERQATVERAGVLLRPFVEHPHLATILAKMKAVEHTLEPNIQVLMDTYGLTAEEAIIFDRHMWDVWFTILADYEQDGGSDQTRALILDLMGSPDHRRFWPHAKEFDYFGEDFVSFVERVVEEEGRGTKKR
jgi:hypothetical protein